MLYIGFYSGQPEVNDPTGRLDAKLIGHWSWVPPFSVSGTERVVKEVIALLDAIKSNIKQREEWRSNATLSFTMFHEFVGLWDQTPSSRIPGFNLVDLNCVFYHPFGTTDAERRNPAPMAD